MARGRKKASTGTLDAKIEQQKAVMEKANLPYLLDCFWTNIK